MLAAVPGILASTAVNDKYASRDSTMELETALSAHAVVHCATTVAGVNSVTLTHGMCISLDCSRAVTFFTGTEPQTCQC